MNPYSTGSPIPDMSPTILTLGKMAMDRQAQNDELAMRERTLQETQRQHNLSAYGVESPEPGQQSLAMREFNLKNPALMPYTPVNDAKGRAALKTSTGLGKSIDYIFDTFSKPVADDPNAYRGQLYDTLAGQGKEAVTDILNQISKEYEANLSKDPNYAKTPQAKKVEDLMNALYASPDMSVIAGALMPDVAKQREMEKVANQVQLVKAQHERYIPTDQGLYDTISGKLVEGTAKVKDNAHNVVEIPAPDGKTAQKFQYNSKTQRYDIPVGSPYAVKSQVPNVNVRVNQPGTDQVDVLAQGVLDGTIDPNSISKRGNLQGSVFARVKQLDPKFNLVQAGASAKWQSANTNMNTKALLNTIDPLLNKLEQSGAILGNSSIPLYNRAVNFIKEQGGSADIVGFNNLRDDVIAEVERGLMGTGVLSDSKYMRALKNVNSAQSYPQLKAAVKNIKTVIQARLESLNAGPYSKQGGSQTTQQTNFRNKYNY